MRRRSQIMWIVIAVFFLCYSGLVFIVWNTPVAWAAGTLASPTPTPLATPAATPPSAPSQSIPFINFGDSTIMAALIGGIFGIPATIITIVSLISTQRADKQRQAAEDQNQEDLKAHQRELLVLQKQHQEDIAKERIRHAREIKEQEEEKKRKKQEEQIRRELMERAQSIEERAVVYRSLFREDRAISHLHILGMTRSLKILDVFVPMRVRLDDKFHAELDQSLREAQYQQDPEVFFREHMHLIQKRFRDALDPVQVIRHHPRCVFLGDPGAGKTTLLKYLALNVINKKLTSLPDLPIYIDLNKFAGSPFQNPLEFAAHQWEQEYNFPQADAYSYMTSNLDNGKALLLLDALDETLIGATEDEAEASYKQVANEILKLSKRYSKSPIVVTARKAGYRQRNIIPGFSQFEILEFRTEDIAQFINNWFDASEKPQKRAKVSSLTKQLERHPRLHSIASNPLLLSLIVIVYEAYNALPEGRTKLYGRCIETLLFDWDRRHDTPLRNELGTEDKQRLLREIAWHFHARRQRYFPEDELLQVIHAFLLTINQPGDRSRQILQEITTINGLLKVQARHLYSFLHLSFQEYFAAEYASEFLLLEELLKYLGDPSWEEVILLYANKVSDASPLLQKLLYGDDEQKLQEDIFHSNLLLAGSCLVDHPRIIQLSLRDEIASHLFDVLTSTHYTSTKKEIIYVLTAIGDKEINLRLLQLLIDEDTDHSLRWQIAETFGTVGEQSIAYELLPLLSDQNIDVSVREAIAEACGRLDNQAIAHSLLRLLDTTPVGRDLYQSIVLALGTLGETRVAPDLLKRLEYHSLDVGLRCSIAEALKLLDDKTTISKLLALLAQKDINQRVRCSIADTLGTIGDSSTARSLFGLLTNKTVDHTVCCHIAHALGRLGEQSLVADLQSLLTQPHINPQVGKSITVVLGMLGEQTVIPELLKILKDTSTDRYILQAIPDVLGMLGGESLQWQLLPLLSDATIDRQVRRGIASTLSKLGDFSIHQELLHILTQERIDLSVRQCLASTIGHFGDRSITSALLDMIDDTHINQYVRMKIAEALTLPGEYPIVHRLANSLFNEQIERNVRKSIAQALEYTANDYHIVELLAKHLYDTDIPEQIFSALWSISRRSGARVFERQEPTGKQITISTIVYQPKLLKTE